MLTHEEKKVVEMLGEVWNNYCELPEEHVNEKDEFFSAIHICQRTVLARAGRRDMKILRAQEVLRVKREGK